MLPSPDATGMNCRTISATIRHSTTLATGRPKAVASRLARDGLAAGSASPACPSRCTPRASAPREHRLALLHEGFPALFVVATLEAGVDQRLAARDVALGVLDHHLGD